MVGVVEGSRQADNFFSLHGAQRCKGVGAPRVQREIVGGASGVAERDAVGCRLWKRGGAGGSENERSRASARLRRSECGRVLTD